MSAPSNHSARDNLPLLRFDSGDVIIKLSDASSTAMVVHREMLCKKMPVVGASLKPEWSKPSAVIHPVSRKSVDVYKLALTVVEDTLLLGSKEPIKIPSHPDFDNVKPGGQDVKLMQVSSLACGWPEEGVVDTQIPSNDLLYMLDDIGTLHHALLAMLYGYPICISAFFTAQGTREQLPRHHLLNKNLPWVCATLALAEYYGAMPFLSTTFIELLSPTKDFWVQVSSLAVAWLHVAMKLRWRELYFNCMRLILSRKDFDVHIREFEMTHAEAEETHASLQAELEPIIRNLEKSLMRLQLTDQLYSFNRDDVRASTTFLHTLRFRSPSRSDTTKANERADCLAKSIYGEWLTNHIAGGETPSRRRSPASFGFKAPERFSSIFKLGFKSRPAERIRYVLNDVVGEAAEIIGNAFPVREKKMEDGTMLTFRRARWDSAEDSFSYMGLDESEVPWDERLTGEGGEQIEQSEIVALDISPACKEYLRALETSE